MHIVVYSKDYCPYCVRAKAYLKSRNIDFTEIDISNNPKLQEECFSKANGKKTVPQIFIRKTHIGGFDDMMALVNTGKFDDILKKEGVL